MLSALAVDSAWLKHCNPPRRRGRQVNLVACRACFDNGGSRLYAYVHNQVPSAAARLDQFLDTSGVGKCDRVTIVTNGAGEFEKAVKGASRPTCRVLDWFHIAMRFRAVEQTALKYPGLITPYGCDFKSEIASCKWLAWYGKGSKAVARLKRVHDAFKLLPDMRDTTLNWNLRHVFWYLRSNARHLVNYAHRYHRGLPISSAIAESAVNEVVSLRTAGVGDQSMRNPRK